MAETSVTAYGMTESTDSKSGNKILKDSAGNVLSITDRTGKQIYGSAYGISENAVSRQRVNNQRAEQKASGNEVVAAAVKRGIETNSNVKNKERSSKWILENIFDTTTPQSSAVSGTIDKSSRLCIQKAVVAASGSLSKGINDTTSSIAEGISSTSEITSEAILDLKTTVNKALKPISSATGSMLGSMTQIAKNPLGAPQLLSNSIVSLVDKINPGLVDQMDSSYKSLQLENLQNLPGQVMGSIRNLATAADAILSVPFTIMSDLYNGLMEIMQELSKMVDELMSSVMDFILGPGGLLDSVFPISALLELLEEVSELASFVGGISQMAGGFNIIGDFAGQIGGFASQASSIVNNPLQLIQAYSPEASNALGSFSQMTGAMRNPEQVFQQFLPPEISDGMKNLSNIPGLGFVGNMGFSIGDSLDSLKQGVITSTLEQFADQLPIIGPLLNQQTSQGEPALTDTHQQGPTTFQTSEVNPNQQASKEIRQITDTKDYAIFKSESKQNNQTSVTAYNMTEYKNSDGAATVIGPWGTTPYGLSESLIEQNTQSPFNRL